MSIYIGLGSNLSNPVWQIQTALQELNYIPGITVVTHSNLYRNPAIEMTDQPDFINAVAELNSELSPSDLMIALLNLEAKHQRVRGKIKSSRTLDLDLLLYHDQRINTTKLTVPHPRLTVRNFVIYPLFEISPNLILPDGTALSKLVTNCQTDNLTLVKFAYE